eukprot:1309258-Pleurochrysis_carterae.AAC.1
MDAMPLCPRVCPMRLSPAHCLHTCISTRPNKASQFDALHTFSSPPPPNFHRLLCAQVRRALVPALRERRQPRHHHAARVDPAGARARARRVLYARTARTALRPMHPKHPSQPRLLLQ